ncbi:Cytolethal distending toxin subunit B precursor [Amycolatopsis sp. M39]|nr:Cytolethal distending toxin subunit B precursor [Amycolatopsis sp. M39]
MRSQSAGHGRLRRWLAATTAALAGPVAVMTVVAISGPPAAQAVAQDGKSPFMGYNMLGNSNGESWSSTIANLARNNPVLALQESGPSMDLPENPTRQNFQRIRVSRSQNGLPGTVTRTTWASVTGMRQVYFLQTDPQHDSTTGQDRWIGGRVNLAMVTDQRADEVRVLDNPLYNRNDPFHRSDRPVLGLRFGETWYWNIHARNQADVPGLLGAVRNVAATDHRRWVLVGDFNVNILGAGEDAARARLGLVSGERLIRPDRPTYFGGDRPSELDYAIASGLPTGFSATVPQAHSADHAPVAFRQNPLPHQPARPAHPFHTTMATPSGTVMQVAANNTTVALAAATYGGNQTFQQNVNENSLISLRNDATGGCLEVVSNARRDASARVVTGDCASLQAQWIIHAPDPDPAENHDDGGPQMWVNAAFPTLCLAASGGIVTAAPCSQDTSQRWWDNPVHVDSGWQEAAANVRLQSAWFDGRLRRLGAVPGTSIHTAQKPPWWWWIYWLTGQEKKDFGWTVERAGTGDNLVRIVSLDGEGRCLGTSDEHAGPDAVVNALLRACEDDRGVDAAGQRWLAEPYVDGSIRLRNEANHLCLLGPDGESGQVRATSCNNIPAERWNIVNP